MIDWKMTMSNETVTVLNQETGDVGTIRRKWFDNPAINNGILVEVDPSQKPYVPELFKSKVPAIEAPVEDEDEADTADNNETEEVE